MTLLHFDLRKPVNTHRFQNSFFTKFKNIHNKQQNLHKKLPFDEI